MTKDTIEKIIREALAEMGIESADFNVEHSDDFSHGDYSTNVAMVMGKKLGKNPKELAESLAEALNKVPGNMFEKVKTAGPGFINFYLSKEFFREALSYVINKGDSFGESEHAKGFKVMVEHTQPNPFKSLHIGHMMNNVIGESLVRIMRANGAEVKTASYHGDVGLHAAKAVWGILNGKENPYADGNKAYEESEEAKKEIIEINKKIYERTDEKINEAYDKGRAESLEEFEKLYALLGSQFDFHFYESESGKVGKELVLDNIGKIFEESEGATVFKGEKYGLHTRVFLNSEKLPTYEAKEVGLAKIKKEKFPFDQSVTVTANEQDAFFNVVEVAIGQVFPELNGKLKHLSHGILKLPSGKMSSRTGEVIPAEALIAQVKEKVKGEEQVAIGAIKYMILRQSIGNDIVFDFEKSVSTEGDSGVYLQYAHARAGSILEKADKEAKAEGERSNIHIVERLLHRFPEIVSRAGAEYAPNYITTYLTELSSAFNNFYVSEQVLG